MRLSAQSWASASVILVAVTSVSKGVGFFRELLLASFFGASGQVDAYAVAYAIPLFLVGGVGFAFSTLVIPGYHQKVVDRGPDAGTGFLAATCLSCLMGSVLLLLPVWLVPEILVRLAAPSLPEATALLTVDLMGWLALYVLLLNMTYVLSAVFHALNHFRVPAASELVFNLIALGIFVALVSRWEVRALVIGNLTGIAVCGLLLGVGLVRAKDESSGIEVEAEKMLNPLLTALPAFAYYICSQFPGLLANYFAAGMGEGSIAAFGYAKTVLAGVVTLITLSIARGAFPTLAILFATGKLKELEGLVIALAKLIVFTFIPLSAMALVYREPLLRLLYQRGAFDDAALQLTATAFGFLALGLTFSAWEPVGMRALYAIGDSRSPLLATIGSACLVVPLLLILTPTLGLAGVALSLSLGLAADGALQIFFLGRRLGSSIWHDLVAFLVKCLSCAFFAASVFIVLPNGSLVAIVSGIVLYACLYALLVRSLMQPLKSIVAIGTAR